MNILIKDIDIITGAPDVSLIKKGCIGVSGDRIAFAAGPGEKAESGNFRADKVIDGRRKLAMPGLVNSHTHCAMTLLRNYADDLALEEWLFDRIFPAENRLTDEDVYWGTLLGIAEMIKSGTTAFADMYLHMEHVARAVEESGIRANLSRNPVKFAGERNPKMCDDSEACFDYYKRWNGSANGRIKVFVEVHSAYLFNEESLRNAACLAKSCGTGIHIHIHETQRELEECLTKYGMDAVEICEKCGIFDVPVIAAHCVHLTGSNIRTLKEKNVSVAHNPTSNLKLGSGIAPVPELMEAGVMICLGTDGPASNNNLDMFEEMHLAALLHKGVKRDPVLVNAAEAIRMATSNGAAALGFGGVAGCITKGFKADLILLDTDKPHLCPINDPISAAVYAAQAADVDTVLVDGNILMENRQLKLLDEEKIKYMVDGISKKIYR